MSADPLNYFEVQDLTAELIQRLIAFIAGDESHESLQAWAQATTRGYSWDGPVPSNKAATTVLMYAWNAAILEC